VATLPLANLQDPQRSRPWRSLTAAGQYFTADFGKSVAKSALALIDHNLAFADQVTIRVSDDAGGMPILFEQTAAAWDDLIGFGEGGFGMLGFGGSVPEEFRTWMAPKPIRVIYLQDDAGNELTVEGRYWTVIFSDSANPDGYIQVGRALLVYHDEYARQFEPGWKYGGKDDSQIDFSEGGQAWTDIRPMRRTVRLRWPAFRNEDKYWRFLFFLQKMGLSRDFVVDCLPGGRPSERFFTTLYGRFSDIPELADFYRYSETELEFEEVL